MINRTFTRCGKTYQRISKKAARKAFNNNENIVICACNLRPFNNFYLGFTETNKNCFDNTFDEFVNAFEFYNCINSETGKYTAFYKEI